MGGANDNRDNAATTQHDRAQHNQTNASSVRTNVPTRGGAYNDTSGGRDYDTPTRGGAYSGGRDYEHHDMPTRGGAYPTRTGTYNNYHDASTRGGAYNTAQPRSVSDVVVIPSIADLNREGFWSTHTTVYVKVCY